MNTSFKSPGTISSVNFEPVFSDFAVTGFPFGFMIIGESAFPKEGALTIECFGFLISSLNSNSSITISESNSIGSYVALLVL